MKFARLLPHLLLILIPFGIFWWLFTLDVTPSGRFTIRHTAGDASPFVDQWLPGSRALGVEQGPDGSFQRIIDEPIYASVHTPGDFDGLTASLQFQNTDQPIIELGILVNEDPMQYIFEPMQNLLIDRSAWDRMEENGVTLLQRAKVYGSVEDFLLHPPDRDTIATYHYDLEQPYRIPDYAPANQLSSIDVSLRGYHEFVTYIKNEPLLVQADFMDMNREYGEDAVTLLVFNENGEPVAEQMVKDDGVVEATSRGSSMRSIAIVADGLPEGVYKVILKANRDIFFRHLATRQRYATFVGPIYFGDEVGYKDAPRSVSVWTDAKNLTFFTYHADAAQRVAIGSGTLAMPEAQVPYTFEVDEPGLVRVAAEAGDFTLTHDGRTAFSERQFFNPDPVKLSWNTDLDDSGINFIVARYSTPTTSDGWFQNAVSFDLANAWNDDGDIKLVLSAPGIKILQNEIHLHRLDLTFLRDPLSGKQLWQKLWEFIF